MSEFVPSHNDPGVHSNEPVVEARNRENASPLNMDTADGEHSDSSDRSEKTSWLRKLWTILDLDLGSVLMMMKYEHTIAGSIILADL